MELMIIAYACKTSCARNIVGVIPYMPYSKQSKMRKRGSVVCKLMASMFGKAGKCHVMCHVVCHVMSHVMCTCMLIYMTKGLDIRVNLYRSFH